MKNKETEKITPNWISNPPEGYQNRNSVVPNNSNFYPEGRIPGAR